jgi:methionyl aminopeptidase
VFQRKNAIEIKSAEQFARMRRAGLVVARTLEAVRLAARPGVTTGALDMLARECLAEHGATSSFLGYRAHGTVPYPAVICTSVNAEVVHGIPGDRLLCDGDLLSVDFGAIVEGWHGDAAISIPVGDVSAEVAELSRVTEASMWAGLSAARAGGRLSDIGHAVETVVRKAGSASSRRFGIVADYGGHGIGTRMHMDPHILNYGRPGQGMLLKPGMALAIEPMVTLGDPEVGVLPDDWTVATIDGRWSAHWEHTVAITEDGPWVLTALEDVRL